MKTRHFILLCPFFVILTIQGHSTFRHLTIADGLPNNQVRQIVELPNGQILLATEGMFSLFNGQRFVSLSCNLDSVRPLPAFGGHDHLWQGDSLLWLKDYYNLYLFDARSRQFRYDYTACQQTASVRRFLKKGADVMAEERRKRLSRWTSVLDSLTWGTSLQGDPLTASLRDRQGGLWLGLRDGGLLYRRPPVGNVSLSPLGNGDVARRMVPIDGRTMLVAGERGIYEYDTERQCIARTLAQSDIYAYEMARDGLGRIWVATSRGLFAYDHGELALYDHTNTTGLIHDHMRFALPLDDRRMLVCNHMHHLGYFYPDERRVELLNPRLPVLDGYRTMVVASPLANRNHVAVCTQNGLFVLDTSTDQICPSRLLVSAERHSRKFNCILHDRTGRTWMGTQNGLLLVADGVLHRLTRADGLSNDCIQSLAEDAQGRIWVGTARGVNRIRLGAGARDIRVRALTADDGLPDVETTERGICLMPDGVLYLATSVGLLSLPVEAFGSVAAPDSLVLVGLSVAGSPMPLDTLPLRLTHRQNYIDVEVSPLDYARPHSSAYRYRLLGLEQEWHTAPADQPLANIRYSAIAPGHYTLEVQASRGDDVWGPVLRKSFHIVPPLWLTWWARALYLLLGSMLAVGLIHIYIRNRRRKLERENEARVNRLFELREEARRRFAQSVEVNANVGGGPTEDALVQRVREAISQNMGNADYTAEQLARDVGMSRANLYKKMQGRLGITPNDFLRNMRLKHAAHLLAESNIPISQVSLMVGFQTPRYFSLCFRRMFGVAPSEYRSGTPPLHTAED